ncbi:COR domain-containing protein [Candidatus Albibeggiatoa sp. nov. NOAA]|uniref:COR domain-containing protein n=1 Tax=Candidatus Albibeggiatoa sp. nov. NOAA TaxID=3162724 RepID=UPI003300E28A|nr:leucine-rich repeat domain-containing protein [Thiotrichaceae bacterium]
MSEKALQRIAEAKQKRLTYLDLDFCNLTELPPELLELDWLEELSLSGNKLSDVSPLAALTGLTSLNLYNNKLSNVSPLAALTGLTSLYLERNQLYDISPLAALTGLTSLYLERNQLSNVSPLAALTGLTSLDLGCNQLSDVSPLATLTKLQKLDLSNNESIYSLKNLLPLIERGLKVKTGWVLTGLIINGCPITEPPQEFIEQGKAAILDYFKQIEQQGGTEKLYEAKLIVVGEGGAGKTTLMEKLFDPNYEVPQPSDSTLGIEVREGWSFPLEDNPDITFKANIWDFGGQEIQYMTHQFFLTPSALYILVSDNREQNTRFPYWFKIIRLLSKEDNFYSPIIVMLNDKQHKSVSNFDSKLYQKHYPELDIKQCDVDLSENDTRFQLLRETIQKALTQLRHVGNQLPKQWQPIREALRELNKDHICLSEFQQICQQHGIDEEESQLNLSGYLHKLGSILHFQNNSDLYDFIILKPQWAVDAVYSVLTDKQVANAHGKFTRQYLDNIWEKYNHAERNKLFNLMKADSFEICYPLTCESDDAYITPQLLPETAPIYDWDSKENLNFRFQYKFMPEGILARLIVRLHDLILKQNDKQLVWRKGVVLTDNGCQAQVIEDENNRNGLNVIDIAVCGNPNERKYLLRKIREEVREIHKKWFKNIEVDEMIPCHCDDCKDSSQPHFYEFTLLQKYIDKAEPKIKCEKDLKTVGVKSLLEGVFEQDELKRVKLGNLPGVHIYNDNRNFNNAGNIENSNINQGDNVQQQLAQQLANLTPEQQAQMLAMFQNKG